MPSNVATPEIDWFPTGHPLESLNGLNPPKSESTNRVYFCTISNFGTKFAESSDLSMFAAMTWATKTADGSVEPDTTIIFRFLSFVFDSIGEDGGASPGNYLAVKKAVPWFLNKQVTVLGRATRMAKGFVNTIAGVKELDKKVGSYKSTVALEEHEDLQADQDPTLNVKQWISISMMLIAGAPVGDFNESPLGFCITLGIMLLGRALASRGEDLRGFVIGCLGAQVYDGIGPEGTMVITAVSRSGKLNSSGRHTRQGMIAHHNPILCPLFVLAMLLLYRWLVANEAHPDWGDEQHATLFIPVFRSMNSGSTPMTYDKHQAVCRAVLEHFHVAAGHTSHFTRGDTARHLEAHLVYQDSIRKFMNRVDDSHAVSYGNNIPADAMCAIGGFGKFLPETVAAAHLSATTGLDGIVDAVLPWLKEQEAKVATATSAAGVDAAKLKKARLFMRRASLKAVRGLVATWVQCACARPRDAKGVIEFDSPPIYERFHTNPVFQAPFFQTISQQSEFIAFVALVRSFEEQERPSETGAAATFSADGVGASPVARRFSAQIQPQLQRHEASLMVVSKNLQNLTHALSCATGSRGQPSASSQDAAGSGASGTSMFVGYAGGSLLGGPPVFEGLAAGSSLLGGPCAEATCQPQPKGSSRHSHVGSGQTQMKNLGEHLTAVSLVDEYVDILKPLEDKGKKWRSYQLGSQAWYDRAHLYRLIDRKMGEEGGTKQTASAALDALAGTAGKQGKSKAPNWKKVGKALRDSDPHEVGLKELKKRKAAENKTKKNEKKQTTELAGADDHITHLARDNSIVPDGGASPADAPGL